MTIKDKVELLFTFFDGTKSWGDAEAKFPEHAPALRVAKNLWFNRKDSTDDELRRHIEQGLVQTETKLGQVLK